MKQILQSARSGELQLVEVPAPAAGPGQVLVQNHFSVVSPGTEQLAMSFARKSLLAKAQSRPDLVKQVLRKVRREGPLPAYQAVVNRLDAPQPLGYSCAGVVLSVGTDVSEFSAGDRVACAGAGYANHAEIVSVPSNLVAHVPDGVALERAAFATLGAIALQGLRIAQPTLGEVVAVIGLGLIGQLAVQLLVANGCRVLAVDINKARIDEALAQGAEWGRHPDQLGDGWQHPATGGLGTDLALVAASSETSAPLRLAAAICRPKGRVVLIGAMPIDLDRRTFYEKELELRLSMSYGPGRYDRGYEELGLDYPLPYVRWTENRNLQAFLALTASSAIHPERIDCEILPFEQAEQVYEKLARGERAHLAVLFRYGDTPQSSGLMQLAPAVRRIPSSPGIAFIGAGNYAKSVLLPALARHSDARRVALVTATGASARRSAERFRFEQCGTDPESVVTDPGVDVVFIATRHDLHAPLACRALSAGKAVWLEKPIGLDPEQVSGVIKAARTSGSLLYVGYNRRFSPHARAIRAAFAEREGPMAIRYTIAAGATPRGTWLLDPKQGGGRVIGESCHFVDLCSYLVGALPASVHARSLSRNSELDDSFVALIGYPDGSVATLEYLAATDADLPKERFEVSAEGRTAICDNYRRTRISGARGVRGINQDKGQAAAVADFLRVARSGDRPAFDLDELHSTSLVTFAILEAQRSGGVVQLETLRV